ncbi:TolC family protein [Flagellimonas sediminis]|uniref:TolC family protein n=1 Tax=Flagellimonas sediminis TaxID=2696468 RepID=A0A6I5KWL4_9FLAO|nr:TolC family protein [Allomuricauda sediminis]NDV42368.1 TolC family protein [Allomuricauda sediminis]
MSTNFNGLFWALLLFGTGSFAQESIPLKKLLEIAQDNYPSIQAAKLRTQAAISNARASEQTLIPDITASYQANYSTYNNLTGMFYPEFVLPVSGPPSMDNSSEMVFGSAASLLLKWEAFTFGRRANAIKAAKSHVGEKTGELDLTTFKHQVNLTDTYLNFLLANEVLKSLQSNLERSKINYEQSVRLAQNGLIAGVDTARFQSAFSNAKIQTLNQKRRLHELKNQLQLYIASELPEDLSDENFFRSLPGFDMDTPVFDHPKAQLAQSEWQTAQYQYKTSQKRGMPSLSLWGTVNGRGSGVEIDANGNLFVEDVVRGFDINQFNYGIGLQLSIPITQQFRYHSKSKVLKYQADALEEEFKEIRLELKQQQNTADSTLQTAILVARELPTQYKNAQFSYAALKTQYASGLVNFTELAEAQHELVATEINHRKAFLEVWKALLYKAAVYGNLEIFLNELNK